jgi:hypothetical protein
VLGVLLGHRLRRSAAFAARSAQRLTPGHLTPTASPLSAGTGGEGRRADSHALVRYLVDPQRLTDRALEALLDAENSDGVVISAASLGDLWYVSQKTSSSPIAPAYSNTSAPQFSIRRQTSSCNRSRRQP